MRPLKYGAVLVQEPLTHAAERAQEVSYTRPDAFDRVSVDFANAIAIIIARPFALWRCMANPLMAATTLCQVAIGRPFIGVDCRIIAGMGLDERLECRTVAVGADLQADVGAAAANHTRNWRSIALGGAMTTRFIGAPTGWVCTISVFAAFLAGVLVEFIGFGHIIR
jgi:hypothetical protein